MAPVYRFLGLSVGVLQMAARTDNGKKAFIVDPSVRDINPDVNGGDIEVTVRPNPDFPANPNEEYAITLSFYVETADGREWDANSEINRENYRFIR